MVVTNKFYLAFFDSTGSTPLYLPLRRGDFLSLHTTFFDKLGRGCRTHHDSPVFYSLLVR